MKNVLTFLENRDYYFLTADTIHTIYSLLLYITYGLLIMLLYIVSTREYSDQFHAIIANQELIIIIHNMRKHLIIFQKRVNVDHW